MPTNEQILRSASLTTIDASSGLLNPEQSKTFLRQTFEKTSLGGQVRTVMRKSKTGVIDKIGISSRILRKKVENIDANSNGSAPVLDPTTGQITGYRAKPNFSQIAYSTVAVRLPWEITEETLRENIEGEGLEATITNLMTTQIGLDTEDLCLNGDEAISASDPDHDFIYINDGWIKLIKNGGHVIDASGVTAGMNLDMFYTPLSAIPNKYNNGNLRWLMSPHRQQEWELFLLNQGLKNSASFPDKLYDSPASIPSLSVPHIPDDIILLTDPKNLIKVHTYDVRIRKTTEGERAIMEDKRFYVVHFDLDTIVEELDATAIITNIG